MRQAIRSKFAFAFAALALAVVPLRAQWATPTVDGSIASGEYGNNNTFLNAGNTGQTWYMTWDASNLYIGIVNANVSEGAVVYIAPNPQNPPTCCSNADGDLAGFTYDGTDFSSLPFRAKFVTYFKNGYREYRNSDGSGGWTAQTANYGQYADNAGNQNTREVAIPWSAITGGGTTFDLCLLWLSDLEWRLHLRPGPQRQQHWCFRRHQHLRNAILCDNQHWQRH